MQIYENALTETTLSIVHRELTNFMETPEKWTPSNFNWDNNIRINVSGTTLVTFVSNGVTELILEDLEDIIPPMTNKKIQYFVWTPNSGISIHDDGHVKFGATIYLNQTWDINDGGLFVYQHEPNDWRVHVPTFNTCTINDTCSLHMVTPVSPFARHNRYTIQIFGDKINE